MHYKSHQRDVPDPVVQPSLERLARAVHGNHELVLLVVPEVVKTRSNGPIARNSAWAKIKERIWSLPNKKYHYPILTLFTPPPLRKQRTKPSWNSTLYISLLISIRNSKTSPEKRATNIYGGRRK